MCYIKQIMKDGIAIIFFSKFQTKDENNRILDILITKYSFKCLLLRIINANNSINLNNIYIYIPNVGNSDETT